MKAVSITRLLRESVLVESLLGSERVLDLSESAIPVAKFCDLAT